MAEPGFGGPPAIINYDPLDFPRCVADASTASATRNISASALPIPPPQSVDQLISEAWLHARLLDGCNCTVLSLLNVERASIFCIEFPVKHAPAVQFFYLCLFTLLILFSSAGNGAVVWIILRHERMRTVTNYYLLNLAISDIAITILNTGFSGTYNFYYHWVFSEAHCAFNNLMGITPICASVFTMIVMSIDRYLAVVHPLKRRPGHGATLTIILTIWLLAFLCGVPAVLVSDVESYYFVSPRADGEMTVFKDRLCLADRFSDGDSRTSTLFSLYNHSLVVIQYLLPLLILCYTYGTVVYVLKRNNTIGDTRHVENVRAKRKAANMLALVVFTFIFMWMPYNLYFLFLQPIIQQSLAVETTVHVYISIYCLGMASCLMNPVIYYFMNERFRVGFRYAFRWLPCVRIKRGDYESAFMVASRVSYPTPKFSNAANTTTVSFSTGHTVGGGGTSADGHYATVGHYGSYCSPMNGCHHHNNNNNKNNHNNNNGSCYCSRQSGRSRSRDSSVYGRNSCYSNHYYGGDTAAERRILSRSSIDNWSRVYDNNNHHNSINNNNGNNNINQNNNNNNNNYGHNKKNISSNNNNNGTTGASVRVTSGEMEITRIERIDGFETQSQPQSQSKDGDGGFIQHRKLSRV